MLRGPGSVAFSVPANTTFVRLNGRMPAGTDNCAPYDVAVSADKNPTDLPQKQAFTPLCTGGSARSVLYEAALAPDATYRFMLTSRGADGQQLGFTNAQFMSSTL